MSRFVTGTKPEEYGSEGPWSYITDEKAVRAEAAAWRDLRTASINFAKDHPQEAAAIPEYYEMYNGFAS